MAELLRCLALCRSLVCRPYPRGSHEIGGALCEQLTSLGLHEWQDVVVWEVGSVEPLPECVRIDPDCVQRGHVVTRFPRVVRCPAVLQMHRDLQVPLGSRRLWVLEPSVEAALRQGSVRCIATRRSQISPLFSSSLQLPTLNLDSLPQVAVESDDGNLQLAPATNTVSFKGWAGYKFKVRSLVAALRLMWAQKISRTHP